MSRGKISAAVLAALRRLWARLLDVLYPRVSPERPPSPSAPVDDLSLGLLFRKPSLWNRRFWRSHGASRRSDKSRDPGALDRH